MAELLRDSGLGGAGVVRRLRPERFEFSPIRLGLACTNVPTKPARVSDTGAFLGFNEDFEIGFGIRVARDLGQQERIDVSARGNQVQIAANAGLGRMNVAEVVGPIDDPEFLVAGSEVEDLLVIRKDDQRREPEFGANGNDIFLRILDDARSVCRGPRRQGVQNTQSQKKYSDSVKREPASQSFHDLFLSIVCATPSGFKQARGTAFLPQVLRGPAQSRRCQRPPSVSGCRRGRWCKASSFWGRR